MKTAFGHLENDDVTCKPRIVLHERFEPWYISYYVIFTHFFRLMSRPQFNIRFYSATGYPTLDEQHPIRCQQLRYRAEVYGFSAKYQRNVCLLLGHPTQVLVKWPHHLHHSDRVLTGSTFLIPINMSKICHLAHCVEQRPAVENLNTNVVSLETAGSHFQVTLISKSRPCCVPFSTLLRVSPLSNLEPRISRRGQWTQLLTESLFNSDSRLLPDFEKKVDCPVFCTKP